MHIQAFSKPGRIVQSKPVLNHVGQPRSRFVEAGRNRFGSIRFGSGFLFEICSNHRFGSVRFGSDT